MGKETDTPRGTREARRVLETLAAFQRAVKDAESKNLQVGLFVRRPEEFTDEPIDVDRITVQISLVIATSEPDR